ncbi:MAG: M23 family metallopeptidase [Saprospiraceae bacterium]|nr:M23 family metallopeptidase [Saprospiraceae bacterium]
MSAEEGTKRSLIERLQDNYRLVILDDDDLREVTSFSFSLLIFYIIISSVIVLLTLMVVSFIVFTPVKRWIPGYGDIKDNSAFVELTKRIDELEKQVQAHDTYTLGLKNMLKSIENTEPQPSQKSPESLKNQDVIESMKTRELDHLVFATPVSGSISGEYDPSKEHFGIDIIAPKGTAVKSIMEGIVLSAEWSTESGNAVVIQHPRNIISLYKHNSAILVKTGQKVQTGQAIAIIGNTGELSTGPHLHLEVWYDGQPVNPKNYISLN